MVEARRHPPAGVANLGDAASNASAGPSTTISGGSTSRPARGHPTEASPAHRAACVNASFDPTLR